MSKEIDKYKKRTQRSASIFEKTKNYLPGGDTRTATFYDPYPIVVAKGEGYRR
jgi:glutamate-1-semialdehyde aminotransferase